MSGIFIVFLGAGSVYFHSTLSLVGQLIDEIAILWVCMAALGAWLPNKYLPVWLQRDRFVNKHLRFLVLDLR